GRLGGFKPEADGGVFRSERLLDLLALAVGEAERRHRSLLRDGPAVLLDRAALAGVRRGGGDRCREGQGRASDPPAVQEASHGCTPSMESPQRTTRAASVPLRDM